MISIAFYYYQVYLVYTSTLFGLTIKMTEQTVFITLHLVFFECLTLDCFTSEFFKTMHRKAISLSRYDQADGLTFVEPLVRSREPL